jgi:hypothetical protein
MAVQQQAGNKHSGTVNVCLHHVEYRYWGFETELSPELEELLEEAAEERAKFCINDGYHSGDLNCVYGDEEIRGWWEIKD